MGDFLIKSKSYLNFALSGRYLRFFSCGLASGWCSKYVIMVMDAWWDWMIMHTSFWRLITDDGVWTVSGRWPTFKMFVVLPLDAGGLAGMAGWAAAGAWGAAAGAAAWGAAAWGAAAARSEKYVYSTNNKDGSTKGCGISYKKAEHVGFTKINMDICITHQLRVFWQGQAPRCSLQSWCLIYRLGALALWKRDGYRLVWYYWTSLPTTPP